jgi:GxxExxY protein
MNLLRGIPFAAQNELSICYKHIRLSKSYIADLLVFNRIIVEIKALDSLTTREDAQLLNYLKATGLQVGVLLNFGASGKLQWRRMVRTAK